MIKQSTQTQGVSFTLDKAVEYELKHGSKLDPNMDRRKLRRTISNRLSAQRSRIRKAQYINGMEKMVNDLEELISYLTPRMQSYQEKRRLLLLQNDSLQKLMEFRMNESKLSEIEVEQKRAELSRLKELENTVRNNTDDSNLYGPQQTADLRFTGHPLTGFHQKRPQLIKSSSLVQSGPEKETNHRFEQLAKDQQAGFTFNQSIEMSTPENSREEADQIIDLYFNFEELTVDQTSASQ
ncbi:hypothetical protein OROGR_032493 [Orobanche gracilis]